MVCLGLLLYKSWGKEDDWGIDEAIVAMKWKCQNWVTGAMGPHYAILFFLLSIDMVHNKILKKKNRERK